MLCCRERELFWFISLGLVNSVRCLYKSLALTSIIVVVIVVDRSLRKEDDHERRRLAIILIESMNVWVVQGLLTSYQRAW